MVTTLITLSYSVITTLLVWQFFRRSYSAPRDRSPSFHVKNWALFGALFGSYAFTWLYTVYPLAWMEEGLLQQLGIILLHSIIILLCSASYSLTGLAFHTHAPQKYLFLLFPLFLTFGEILRSLFLSLLYFGNGGRVGLHFTAATTGDTLSITPFVEFAYYGGTFALTFTLGLLIYLYESHHSRKHKARAFFFIWALWLITHAFPVHYPHEDLIITSVSTNFPNNTHTQIERGEGNDMFRTMFNTVDTLVKEASLSDPNIIALPEDTRYRNYFTKTTKLELLNLFKDTLFVDGSTLETENGLMNETLFYNLNNSYTIARGKVFLFPFSEYIPSLFTPFFSFFAGPSNDASQQSIRHYSREKSYVGHAYRGSPLGTLLCSELLSFQTIKEAGKSDPDILFFQSNLSVFNGSHITEALVRMSAKTAAAQLRTTIISSTNNAENFAITPWGVIASLTPPSFGVYTYSVSRAGVQQLQSP